VYGHPLTRHHLDLSLLDHGPGLCHNADGSETIITLQAFSRLVIGLNFQTCDWSAFPDL
jgi:hypothetical protein